VVPAASNTTCSCSSPAGGAGSAAMRVVGTPAELRFCRLVVAMVFLLRSLALGWPATSVGQPRFGQVHIRYSM
jgi:hypothetical protein